MSVIDDINKRRTRQSVGEQPAAAPVEPVAPSATVTPQTVQRRPSEDVAPAQPQVQEPVLQSMGDQASARVSQGENGTEGRRPEGLKAKVKGEDQTGLNPTAEQVATAMALMNPAAPQAAAVPQVSAPAVEPVTTYTDIAKRISPELDAEAKAKREKQLRTKKQVAAIGDAISALANMHYTGTSGVNAYDPSATLSGKAKESYDKFLADAKSYEEAHKAAMLRGAELDAAATEARRKEAVADARYKEHVATAAKNAKQAQENWQATFDYNKEKDAADRQERAAARAEENKTKTYIADLNARIRKELFVDKSKANAVKTAKGLYGKRTPHGVDGYPIYDKVWNGGWPEVFNTLVINNAGRKDGEGDYLYEKRLAEMTPIERQNFVDAHYKDYPEAVALMARMAADTPERYVDSIIADEDDYSQYAVGGDEYSQYIIE